jgi:predicted glycoside hydrolase/deacetylase ChbG (UPF0249 family)
MCHPGYADRELVESGTRLVGQREVEMLALTAPNAKDLVAERGIQLVTYQDVAVTAQESKAAA